MESSRIPGSIDFSLCQRRAFYSGFSQSGLRPDVFTETERKIGFRREGDKLARVHRIGLHPRHISQIVAETRKKWKRALLRPLEISIESQQYAERRERIVLADSACQSIDGEQDRRRLKCFLRRFSICGSRGRGWISIETQLHTMEHPWQSNIFKYAFGFMH